MAFARASYGWLRLRINSSVASGMTLGIRLQLLCGRSYPSLHLPNARLLSTWL
jgi:hypothetical protein